MILNKELAKKIVNEVKNLTDENIIIINRDGIIIASTDQSRINDYHEGATIVLESKQTIFLDSSDSEKLIGVHPGINLPINFDNEIIGVIGITGNPQEIEPFANLFKRMTELIVKEAYFIEKREWEIRGLESLIFDWLHSDNITPSLFKKGALYGIDFKVPYQCIVLDFTQDDLYQDVVNVQKFVESWFKSFFSAEDNCLLVPWGHGKYLILNAQPKQMNNQDMGDILEKLKNELYDRFDIRLAAGVGQTVEEEKISNSYNEASKALEAAKKNHTVVFYENLLIEILTGELKESTRKEYVTKVLKPIQNNEELLDTLEVYLNFDQSLSETSKKLHVHLNTLNYRLRKIHELTNINPKTIEGATILYLAIFLAD